jgi:hypothetical protein
MENSTPTLVEVVGEEALSRGEPPEIVSWPVHNHNVGA